MERNFNIYSTIWRYLQLFEDNFKRIKDIFKSYKLKISLNELKISSNDLNF